MTPRTKRIAYDYAFQFFGDATYKGKKVTAANVTLNIRPYKCGGECYFEEGREIKAGDWFLNQVFHTYFDRYKLFYALRNNRAYKAFLDAYGWDRIEAEPVRYSLDVEIGKVRDFSERDTVDRAYWDSPVSEPWAISEKEFKAFLMLFADNFDYDVNKPAQTPTVIFYDGGFDMAKHWKERVV